MKDYSEYFHEAVASFLAQNPTLQKELANITVDEAESIGNTVETLRTQVMNQRFVEHAAQLGIDTVNLVVQFIDVPEDEKDQILKNYHQNFTNSLGIDWQFNIAIKSYLSIYNQITSRLLNRIIGEFAFVDRYLLTEAFRLGF